MFSLWKLGPYFQTCQRWEEVPECRQPDAEIWFDPAIFLMNSSHLVVHCTESGWLCLVNILHSQSLCTEEFLALCHIYEKKKSTFNNTT